MDGNERKDQLGELINLAMDCMAVAVTIIDTKGTKKGSELRKGQIF